MPEELRQNPGAFLYFGKMSSFSHIDEFKIAAAPVNVIYSQWLGYLDGSHPEYYGSARISAFRTDPAINFVYAHTSGHATVEDLKKLATALKPSMMVPIHTEHADLFQDHFDNVTRIPDGEPFILS
jgi:ribonuclease J